MSLLYGFAQAVISLSILLLIFVTCRIRDTTVIRCQPPEGWRVFNCSATSLSAIAAASATIVLLPVSKITLHRRVWLDPVAPNIASHTLPTVLLGDT